MTIADQITRIKNAKEAIKQSIENKGVTVSDTAKLDEYPALIDSITVGSGEETSSYWPDFFEFKYRRTFNGINVVDARYLFSYTCVIEGEEKYKRLIENLDTSNITYIDCVFYYFCYSMNNPLKDLDLTKWNTNNFVSFNKMFSYCGVESLNISGWNFGITSFKYLFEQAKIKSINMTDCNTSNITDFSYTFYNASELTSVNITGCDTSNATTMSYMFYYCSKLTEIMGELDCSNLSGGLFPSTYASPFMGCNKLETLYLKNIYKDCTITNASKFSINLADTKVKDECLIYIINELPDLINDKGLTATDKIVLTLPKTNTLTAEQVQVAISKGWQVANTTY